jgi:hypothetical protein
MVSTRFLELTASTEEDAHRQEPRADGALRLSHVHHDGLLLLGSAQLLHELFSWASTVGADTARTCAGWHELSTSTFIRHGSMGVVDGNGFRVPLNYQ